MRLTLGSQLNIQFIAMRVQILEEIYANYTLFTKIYI